MKIVVANLIVELDLEQLRQTIQPMSGVDINTLSRGQFARDDLETVVLKLATRTEASVYVDLGYHELFAQIYRQRITTFDLAVAFAAMAHRADTPENNDLYKSVFVEGVFTAMYQSAVAVEFYVSAKMNEDPVGQIDPTRLLEFIEAVQPESLRGFERDLEFPGAYCGRPSGERMLIVKQLLEEHAELILKVCKCRKEDDFLKKLDSQMNKPFASLKRFVNSYQSADIVI